MNASLRNVYLGLIALAILALGAAFKRPSLFTDPKYLGALLLAEVIMVCLWRFEEFYFPFLLLTFLWAGTVFPMRASAQTVRWVVLGCASWFGLVVWIRRKGQALGFFHLMAFFCVIAALASALVSSFPLIASLKAGSLALLFSYSASGLRVAFQSGRERFIRGVVLGCEILVFSSALSYFALRIPLYGNPNSLGGVMAFLLPVLLWSLLTGQVGNRYYRQVVALLLAFALLYSSIARAAILAVTVAAVVLLGVLRRRRLLFKCGFVIVMATTLLAVISPKRFDSISRIFVSDIVYKGHDRGGLFASRTGPWSQTVDSIKKHPWLGSGYGTKSTILGNSIQPELINASIPAAEYANSYLAIADYMGFVGLTTFGSLLLLIVWKLARVWIWVHKTGYFTHYIVPIALIVTVGLIHAAFEDWLTAPGSYFCIFFWPFVFLLMDFSPDSGAAPAKRIIFSSAGYAPAFGPASASRHSSSPPLSS